MAKSKASPTSSKPKRINGAKKGKQFERDVANALGHIFPNAERMLEYQASGNIGVDIKGTGCFKIQCKRNANYAPIGKIHEVRTEDPNDIPVLVTKGNHLAPMAVLPFEALIRMLEVMHGMSPLLAKPEDTSTKAIHDSSSHLSDAIAYAQPKPLVVGSDMLKAVNIEPGAITYKNNSTKSELMGLPIKVDEDLSKGEISTTGILRGVECNRLVDLSQGNTYVEALIHHLEKLKLLGHNVTSINCYSEEDLFDKIEEMVYPVVTSEITSLNELI